MSIISLVLAACTLDGAKLAAETWQKAFAAGDTEAIVALYEPDAVLNPTLSETLVVDQAERGAYFEGLFATLTDRTVSYVDTRFRAFGPVVVHSGHWTFEGIKDGAPAAIPARVTFVYSGESCKIVDHHSSLMP